MEVFQGQLKGFIKETEKRGQKARGKSVGHRTDRKKRKVSEAKRGRGRRAGG